MFAAARTWSRRAIIYAIKSLFINVFVVVAGISVAVTAATLGKGGLIDIDDATGSLTVGLKSIASILTDFFLSSPAEPFFKNVMVAVFFAD